MTLRVPNSFPFPPPHFKSSDVGVRKQQPCPCPPPSPTLQGILIPGRFLLVGQRSTIQSEFLTLVRDKREAQAHLTSHGAWFVSLVIFVIAYLILRDE